MTKLWGGRFTGGLDPFFADFNSSLPYDQRWVQQDIEGSIAWARALGGAGVLGKGEVKLLVRALKALAKEVAADPALLTTEDEDVHSLVERKLTAKLGPLARKLHAGRSRNDQVATDLKLYLKRAIPDLDAHCRTLMLALAELAEQHADLPIPGYTHMQRAQPVTIGHHALAYVEMLARDRSRIADGLVRLDTCPLGSGALAGTGLKIDRRSLARELGFRGGPCRNSMDAVADRDHVCELLFVCSMILVHLSRLAEDWIFFATQEAGYVEFSDAVATGSSLMPQKKNPDAMELIRGKSGRVTGHLMAMLMTIKGLPLAYNKDMQEDKEGLFDTLDTCGACLEVATTAARGLRFDAERCRLACTQGYLNSTDLADLLVAAGVPFRDAHERVGGAVREAMQLDVELDGLPKQRQEELFGEITGGIGRKLSLEKVLGRHCALGGTAPSRVRREARSWLERLAR